MYIYNRVHFLERTEAVMLCKLNEKSIIKMLLPVKTIPAFYSVNFLNLNLKPNHLHITISKTSSIFTQNFMRFYETMDNKKTFFA